MRKHLSRLACLLLMVALLVPAGDAHAGDHTHVYETVTIAATCTKTGSTYERCTICSETRNWVTTPMVAHTWGGWSVDVTPTCVREGREKSTCSVCNTVQYRSLGYTDHVWGGWVDSTPATCFTPGQRTNTCSVCGTPQRQAIPQLTHNWSGYVVTTPPSCTVGGVQTSTCSLCGTTRTLAINATGHTWGGWVVEKAPSCTDTGMEKRTCSICGEAQYRMINAAGHKWSAWGVLTAATCTEIGEEKRECTVCGAYQLRYVKALGHDFGPWKETKPAQCLEQGENTATCKRCGQTVMMKTKALGHNWGPWSVSIEATCTQYGQEKRTCTRCGAEQTRRTSRAKHQPRPNWYASPEPSLERPGRKVQYCAVCGKVVNSQEYAPDSYRYGMPATGFGPFAYQFNTQLVGSTDRLIPLDFASGQPLTLPIITVDNYYVGDLNVRLTDHVVTVDYRMNDPRTVVSNASFLLLASLLEVSAEHLTYAYKGYPMESAVPFTGDKGILMVRMTVNYDQKNAGNRPFPEDGMYVDGSTLNSEVLRQMVLQLSEPAPAAIQPPAVQEAAPNLQPAQEVYQQPSQDVYQQPVQQSPEQVVPQEEYITYTPAPTGNGNG